MKKFLLDFTVAFAEFIWTAILILVEIIAQVLITLKKFFDNVIKPLSIELLADLNMFSNIMMQSFCETSSKLLVWLSGWQLKLARALHKKSEELIDRCW